MVETQKDKLGIFDIYHRTYPELPHGINLFPLEQLFNYSRDIAFIPHRLHFYAINIFTECSGKHYMDFKPYDYSPGALLFISKEQVLAYEKREMNRGWVITFTEAFLQKHDIPSNLFSFYRYLSSVDTSPFLQLEREGEEFLEIMNHVKRIREEFLSPAHSFKEQILATLLRVFLLKVERLYKVILPPFKNQFGLSLFQRFRSLLELHYLTNRNVKFYANVLNVTSKQLNFICKKYTLKTTKQFIDNWVVLEIKRHMVSSSFSMFQLAERFSFDETANMVKFFKNHTGLTPKQFRSKQEQFFF